MLRACFATYDFVRELVFVERGERPFRHDDAWTVRCLFPNRDNRGDGWDGDGRGCYE
jgi:hypothetical protein